VLILLWQRNELPPESTPDISGKEKEGLIENSFNLVPLFSFIIIISVVGALTQFVMNHLFPVQQVFVNSLSWLPYFILLFIAGSMTDRFGLRRIALIGVILAGIGFMSAGLLTGSAQYLTIQFLACGGYAFLDTFLWIAAADLSGRRKVPLIFSIVIGLYALFSLAGSSMGSWIISFEGGIESITISISGVLIILCLSLIFLLKETRNHKDSGKFIHKGMTAEGLIERYDLSKREAEIALLLLSEVSTEEIQKRLSIASTTLKSHSRNIYRKAGVRSRLELTLKMFKASESAERLAESDILDNTDRQTG
jgi:DNA-binding CsgD family transcriptional regulator